MTTETYTSTDPPRGSANATHAPLRIAGSSEHREGLVVHGVPARARGRVAIPGIRLRASERKALLSVVDYLILCAALVASARLRSNLLDAPGALASYWYWFAALLIVWWAVATLLECYDLARASSGPHSILTPAGAVALTVFIYVSIPVFTPPLISRKLIFVFGLLAAGGVVLWRGLYAVLFLQPSFHRHALVFGAGQAGQGLIAALRGEAAYGNPFHGSGYEIIGFVDDDPAKQAAGQVAGIPVLGSSADLARLTAERCVDEIVLAITQRHTMSETAMSALLACWERGVPVCTMPEFYERLLGRVPVDHIGRNLASVLPADQGWTARLYQAVKRGADVLIAIMGLALTAALAPVVALANVVFNPGPLFYRQTRVGQAGHPFTLAKFRTMQPDAENNTGVVWTAARDPRITAVGRLLRKTRMDELPQMLNVMRGDMSLVGPRPERPEFVDRLAAQIPFYRARHAVRPGLTGWAQVRYGYGNTLEHSRTKLEYDLYYVRHAGLYLDLVVLLKTIAVVLRLSGE
jgi:exopolysaccharide biosynthesis polyprenyl glycosylphosphotransferase